MLEWLFKMEVRLQCKVLLTAADDLAAATDRLRKPSDMSDVIGRSDDVWIALQQLLVAAANISKLLWGSKGKKEETHAGLRADLRIANTSPLRDVDLRNDWEHVDERI